MKILLLGASGQLGTELARQLPGIGNLVSFSQASLDITHHAVVRDAVLCVRPDIIVNAAAYTAVDTAENERELAYAINADAIANLAKLAHENAIWLIHYSTDYVFDGSKSTPYMETDEPAPINVYGASKLSGEQAIAQSKCNHLIFRTTWIMGKDGKNFAKTILQMATEQNRLRVVSDQQGVPTSPALITQVTLDAIRAIKNDVAWPKGIYHLVPQGTSTWHEIAQTLLHFATQHRIPLSAHAADIQAITTNEYPTAAQRPLNSRLDTHKLSVPLSFDLPDWKDDFLVVAEAIIKERQAI